MDTSPPRIEDLLVHGAWLRRLASSLVVAESDADDLVQETWLAALVRGPAHREEARAWLARVLRNKAGSRARSRGSRESREQSSSRPESLPSAATLAGRADMNRRLVDLVLELPAESQRILLARYFEGISSAEIARRLGRPTGSVRSQLKRGLDELRERLDAENDGERERWLGALTPLASPGRSGSSLVAVLATSVGVRVALTAGLAFLAAGAWWLSRVPESVPPLLTVTAAADTEELVPVETESIPSESVERELVHASGPTIARNHLEGRVVHPESGEAVVWFELGVVPSEQASLFDMEVTADTQVPLPDGMELLRTDEDGYFVSELEYASGDYLIVPIEDWRVAHTPVDLDRIRQPRAPMSIEHDADSPEPHTFELEAGPVFVVDCQKALELGHESMVAIYSHLDHFPPGYFRPSPLQVTPVPFVRMHTDYASTHANKVTNLRLVSEDGFWSGSVPMEIPDSIATQYVSFDLEARALVEVELDFAERKPPMYLELQYWRGAIDPTAEGAPEPDITELQAKFDGTDLEEAIVKYVPHGLATLGIKASTSEYWHRVVDLRPGHNSLEAALLPDPAATGRIEGRVVYMGEQAPEQIVRVIANGTLHGEPTFPSLDLEFEQQGSLWIAEFVFTHLSESAHTVWFDRGGPASHDPKTFAVEPARSKVEVNGPPIEFELHTDLTKTRLQVKVRDAVTGDKVRDFSAVVFVPGAWVRSRQADSKAGRVKLNLLGKLEGGMAILAAEGYIRRDVALSEASESSRGLELELDLTPGWGGPLYATHADTEEPLAGVRVLLDGSQVGVTDEDGKLQLEVGAAPERVTFELEGYEVVSQGGWVDSTGEVIEVGLDPIRQYIGVRMRER